VVVVLVVVAVVVVLVVVVVVVTVVVIVVEVMVVVMVVDVLVLVLVLVVVMRVVEVLVLSVAEVVLGEDVAVVVLTCAVLSAVEVEDLVKVEVVAPTVVDAMPPSKYTLSIAISPFQPLLVATISICPVWPANCPSEMTLCSHWSPKVLPPFLNTSTLAAVVRTITLSSPMFASLPNI